MFELLCCLYGNISSLCFVVFSVVTFSLEKHFTQLVFCAQMYHRFPTEKSVSRLRVAKAPQFLHLSFQWDDNTFRLE